MQSAQNVSRIKIILKDIIQNNFDYVIYDI